jgi:glycosyltransferase involved in cell wall biosynthesis
LGLCADRVIFSSSFEREAFLRFYPWKRKTSKVIPIGSNIPSVENEEKDYDNIVFFGLIAPNKGIEDFLLLARLSLNKLSGFHFTVIGKIPESFNEYYRELRKKTDNMPIEWIIGLQEYEVANKLAHAGFGYLPFPDGVSERRGSLLALISNGVVTVTNQGIHTPKEFASFLYYSTSPNDALIKIQKLKENNSLISEKKHNMNKYIEAHTWINIAKQHLEVYRDVHKY